MKIRDLRINGIDKPLGFSLKTPSLTFIVESEKQKIIECNLLVATDLLFTQTVYKQKDVSSPHLLSFDLQPRTRYYLKIIVSDSFGEQIEEITWFETAKMDEKWIGKWITPNSKVITNPKLFYDFELDKTPIEARLYCTGLGLYETAINHERVSDEYLAPGYHEYKHWIQYQTYDVTSQLVKGMNTVEVILGDGWYKGHFGPEGGKDALYGDQYKFIAELHVLLADGTSIVLGTDQQWQVEVSSTLSSSIYNGEIRDDRRLSDETEFVTLIDSFDTPLVSRLSVPVKVHKLLQPKSIFSNPYGQIIIDYGQNIAGWLAFNSDLPVDEQVKFEFGEVLIDSDLYVENLREAKAQFIYTSDGESKVIRPRFTYYGFRYVRVTGMTLKQCESLIAEAISSDLPRTGNLTTNNSTINQLISNAYWSQLDNYVDIPTDCPQRDERLGWTGDAQIFCTTGAFFKQVQPFFKKYLTDLSFAQRKDGAVPKVVPDYWCEEEMQSPAAWGDAATIIPWEIYQIYGDIQILRDQIESMCSWVNYVQSHSHDGLWSDDFQYGDWLALDGEDPLSPEGKTDKIFIASVYAYVSAMIVARALKILDDVRSEQYIKLSKSLREKLIETYLTEDGYPIFETQTAYVLLVYFEIYHHDHKDSLIKGFIDLLERDNYQVLTGFVGTPYLCLALSKYHLDDIAYKMLLNEKCPSWLYPISMGATTIWERWDSMLPDGSMNPQEMNSLNHYAYGSIVRWMVEYMAGIKQSENSIGYQKVIFSPRPNSQISEVHADYNSPSGRWEIGYKLEGNHFILSVCVPHGKIAEVVLPNAAHLQFENYHSSAEETDLRLLSVSAGRHRFEYDFEKEGHTFDYKK